MGTVLYSLFLTCVEPKMKTFNSHKDSDHLLSGPRVHRLEGSRIRGANHLASLGSVWSVVSRTLTVHMYESLVHMANSKTMQADLPRASNKPRE